MSASCMSRKEKERNLMKEGKIEGGEIFHSHTKEKKCLWRMEFFCFCSYGSFNCESRSTEI